MTNTEKCIALAKEARILADAFRPKASEGQIIRIPVVIVRKLVEVIEDMAIAMESVAKEAERLEQLAKKVEQND